MAIIRLSIDECEVALRAIRFLNSASLFPDSEMKDAALRLFDTENIKKAASSLQIRMEQIREWQKEVK